MNTLQQIDREQKLYNKQNKNYSDLRKALISEFGTIITHWRDTDGWMDGFMVDLFLVKTPKGYKVLKGNDDNTAVYEEEKGGGWGIIGTLRNDGEWRMMK